jgi:hypothetical protein
MKVTPLDFEKVFTFEAINISFSASSKVAIVINATFGCSKPPLSVRNRQFYSMPLTPEI